MRRRLSCRTAVSLWSVQDTEAALKEMDLNGDGKYQAVEVGGQIGRLMIKARDQAKVTPPACPACRNTCG